MIKQRNNQLEKKNAENNAKIKQLTEDYNRDKKVFQAYKEEMTEANKKTNVQITSLETQLKEKDRHIDDLGDKLDKQNQAADEKFQINVKGYENKLLDLRTRDQEVETYLQ